MEQFKIINHQLLISNKCNKELTGVNASMSIICNKDERSKREQHFTCNLWNVNPSPLYFIKHNDCAVKRVNEMLFSTLKLVLLFIATRRNNHIFMCYGNSLSLILPKIPQLCGASRTNESYSSIRDITCQVRILFQV